MHSRIRDSDSHAMLFCPSFAQMERTKVRQWPHLSASPALKRGAEGFKYCGEVGSLWSHRRRGTKHAPPAPPKAPRQCSVFVVPLRADGSYQPSRAAGRGHGESPEETANRRGQVIYPRSPVPLKFPDVCEILLLQQTD